MVYAIVDGPQAEKLNIKAQYLSADKGPDSDKHKTSSESDRETGCSSLYITGTIADDLKLRSWLSKPNTCLQIKVLTAISIKQVLNQGVRPVVPRYNITGTIADGPSSRKTYSY